MNVPDVQWAIWTFAVEAPEVAQWVFTCTVCEKRMFVGIWAIQCDHCGFEQKYPLPGQKHEPDNLPKPGEKLPKL